MSRNIGAAPLSIYSGGSYRYQTRESKQIIKVNDEIVKKCIQETYKSHASSLKSFTFRFSKEVSKLKHEIAILKKTNKSILDKMQTLEDSMKSLSDHDNSDFNEVSSSDEEDKKKPVKKKTS